MNEATPEAPTPLPEGSRPPQPVGSEAPRLARPAEDELRGKHPYPKPSLSDVAAALAAYAAGAFAAFAGAVFWPLMGVAIGALAPRARFAGMSGLVAGGIVAALLKGSLAPGPAFEGPYLGALFGPPFALLSAAIGVPLGARLVPRPRFPARPVARPSPTDIAMLMGAVAVGLTGTTGAVQLAVPSRASFAIDLPIGWSGRIRTPSDAWFDPTYGNHFTAVFGSTQPPPSRGLPASPVVGVSVIQADYDPRTCINEVHGWSSRDFPLYLGSILSEQDVALTAGPAHRIARVLTPRSEGVPSTDSPAAAPQSGRLYTWGITRERQVGILHESLCYMLVVTLPGGSTLGAADADAIAASFRFR